MKHAIIVLTLLVAACSGGGAATSSPPTVAPLPDRTFDLTDPATQRELGAPPFEPVGWQRFVGPFTAVGDRELPIPGEVDLMSAAASDIPAALAAPVRNIVRTATAPPSHLEPGTAVAVALGPDVYLLDRVFTLEGGTTRFAITYALAHEIVHVHQWFALDGAYLNAAARGEVDRIDLASGSSLVRDFAAAVGWVDPSDDPLTPTWELSPDSPAATAYGAVDPAEDMAEAVALAVTGRGNWLDDARQEWVAAFLGADLDEIGHGQPWVPAGAEEIGALAPLYDVATVEGFGSPHIEPTYFRLPESAAVGNDLAEEVTEQLVKRGTSGSLAESEGRWSGAFTRPDGSVWWVELAEVATGEGNTERVLSYVMLW